MIVSPLIFHAACIYIIPVNVFEAVLRKCRKSDKLYNLNFHPQLQVGENYSYFFLISDQGFANLDV